VLQYFRSLELSIEILPVGAGMTMYESV